MTKTHSKSITAMAIAVALVTATTVYTFVCLFSGSITPLLRVTAIVTPVWFGAARTLLCTLL